MKKVTILFLASSFLASCGTVHKVENKTSVSKDSSAASKRDSSSSHSRDSVSRVVDHSLVTTTEHIVTETNIPAVNLVNKASLLQLASKPITVVTDTGDSLVVSYDAKDNTVIASLSQKAHVLKQTIDRTIQEHKDVSQDTKVIESAKTKVKATAAIKIGLKAAKEDDKEDRTGSVIPWYAWLAIAVIVGVGLVYCGYRILMSKK
jgi:hypothetical protein